MSELIHPEVVIMNAALELDEAGRPAYLDNACAGDVALRQRVEELLRAHEQAEHFLQAPPAGLDLKRTMLVSVPLSEKPGDKIGRYKLLQQIGEGGCGVVYMAEQEEPVRRRVALKVIKLGMDTKSVIARFEAERQALALMDHPNIAKVLDAGATEAGRPYFVMELVRGIKITEYCDQGNLTTRERLDLFVQVCRAVQHAHQKGIIHRDLKPSNILITVNDGVPVPKVIDFGIAKATQGRLTDKTLFTAFEQFIGTPAYMSPEQAEMTSLDIDTRSDIYSLGVLLYELLTGKTPFDPNELFQAGLDAMRRTIREKEPPKPSTRLSTMLDAERTLTAKHRQTESPKLIHLVRGDLDWIAMKCLEKDRVRRYETANGLAADIQRHLDNEPVTARPPSSLYRLQKAMQRNKRAFAAAAGVLAALVVGLGIASYSFVREKQAAARALASANTANTEAGKSKAISAMMQDMLARISSQLADGRDTTKIKAIVDQTLARFASELKEQPEADAEFHLVLGKLYFDMGDYAAAGAMFRNALHLLESSGGGETETAVECRSHLGEAQRLQGDLALSEKTLREALGLSSKVKDVTIEDRADMLTALATTLWDGGNLAESEKLLREVLEIQTNLPPDHADLPTVLDGLGLVQWEQGHLPEAEQNLRQALNLSRIALGNHPDVAPDCVNLSLVLRDEANLTEAETLLRETLRLLPDNHPNAVGTRWALGTVLRRRAAVSSDPGLLSEALRLDPTDQFTADALAANYAKAALTPMNSATNWRFTAVPPASNWFASDFPDTGWTMVSAVSGFSVSSPRSARTVSFRTNLWMRQEFDLPNVPAGKVVLRLNRNHDAQMFVNGVSAGSMTDWSDADVVVPCSTTAQAALKKGRNLLAVHCEDADGGTGVDVGMFVTQDTSLGRDRLIEEFNQLIVKQPQRAELYFGRASAHARLGRWNEAAADLAQAITLNPSSLIFWYQRAPLLVQTGNLTAYEKCCRQALERFAQPDDPMETAQAARLCLLRPLDGTNLVTALKLAESAAPGEHAPPSQGLAMRQVTMGLAEYRRGRFESAIAWMDKAQVTAARKDLPLWTNERQRNIVAMANLVQAMAHHQLGQAEASLANMARATDLVQTQFPQANSGDIGRGWPEWLMVQILVREAGGLLDSTPTQSPIPN
jgi:eukaryotic-like serine/threonine-protein kinase